MAQNDETQADLARLLSLSRNAVSDRFRGASEWTLGECYTILNHYHQPHHKLSIVFPMGGKNE